MSENENTDLSSDFENSSEEVPKNENLAEQFFECSSCDKKFTAAKRLQNHIEKEHTKKDEKKEKTEKKDGFFCETCSKNFTSQKKLDLHISRVHGAYLPDKTKKKTETKKYIPAVTQSEFIEKYKTLSVNIVSSLFISLPMFISCARLAEKIEEFDDGKKQTVATFMDKHAKNLYHEVEDSWDLWGPDFYQLLVDIHLLNILIKIKYLQLVLLATHIAKTAYAIPQQIVAELQPNKKTEGAL